MTIEHLQDHHHLQDFQSSPRIDRWLKINALNDQHTNRARIFVKLHNYKVVGWYSSQICNSSTGIKGLLLLNVAVDIRHQRKGYGRELMHHAMSSAHEASDITGLQGILTYTTDLDVPFFKKFGFIMINETNNEMFRKMPCY